MLSRPRACVARPAERGSVVLAMSVMMILLLLGVAILMRSQTQLVAASTNTDAAAAEAGAEQGIAEALAMLDNGRRGDFSATGTLLDGTFAFAASEVNSTSYVVRSEARVGDVTRAVEVVVDGQAAEGHTMLIDTSADFADNAGTITGVVGTNGPIDARNSTPPGDHVELFGPRATCSGCPSTTSYSDARTLATPVVPSSGRRCPWNGQFTGVLDGQNGTPYVCARSHVYASWITFSGTVEVINGPLIVYVRRGLDTRFRYADVNIGNDPNDFQLFGEGDDDYWWMDAWYSEISGVLYAPGRDSWMGDVDLTGSLAVGLYEVRDGLDVSISPTPTSGGTAGWTVSSWERVRGS